MKTEDVVTVAVLGIAIYAVLNTAFAKKSAPATSSGTSPIPTPGGVNPASLNQTGYIPDVDFGLTDPTGAWS